MKSFPKRSATRLVLRPVAATRPHVSRDVAKVQLRSVKLLSKGFLVAAATIVRSVASKHG